LEFINDIEIKISYTGSISFEKYCMKLLLTSAGLSNESIVAALLELTGKPFAELNIAFIPTAANVEGGDKTNWFIKDLIRLKNLRFKSIDIVDISAISKNVWLPRLQDADVLYVEGGNTAHLMYWMTKSGLQELLPEMLREKVYVGVSAGSMVTCNDLALNMSEQLYGEYSDERQRSEGMKFVDFSIIPHLGSPHFPNVSVDNLDQRAKDIQGAFYVIDDNTAVKVIDEEVTVISEGEWKKFN
jgi:dipeptidase E